MPFSWHHCFISSSAIASLSACSILSSSAFCVSFSILLTSFFFASDSLLPSLATSLWAAFFSSSVLEVNTGFPSASTDEIFLSILPVAGSFQVFKEGKPLCFLQASSISLAACAKWVLLYGCLNAIFCKAANSCGSCFPSGFHVAISSGVALSHFCIVFGDACPSVSNASRMRERT